MAKAVKGERPKGAGKKGGTRFPNYSLKQLLPNLKELVSKTHGKTITIQQLNAGVFKLRTASSEGGIKYSSLKQFGLAGGEYPTIGSKQLASNIEFSSGEEKFRYIREAFFNVPSFKNTFDTFHGDSTPRSKIKGYSVSTLKIHPDLADKFVKSLVESGESANLCIVNGEDVTFSSAKDVDVKALKSEVSASDDDTDDDFDDNELNVDIDEDNGDDIEEPKHNGSAKRSRIGTGSPTIEIKLDSSLDPDKLEKQLKVLRRFRLV